jgi:hypothetical protein
MNLGWNWHFVPLFLSGPGKSRIIVSERDGQSGCKSYARAPGTQAIRSRERVTAATTGNSGSKGTEMPLDGHRQVDFCSTKSAKRISLMYAFGSIALRLANARHS